MINTNKLQLIFANTIANYYIQKSRLEIKKREIK